MKSNFNQYFNVLLSCKHRFKLWWLFLATSVIFSSGPSLGAPCSTQASLGAEALQKAASAPPAVLSPGRNLQVVFICSLFAMPFLLLTQELSQSHLLLLPREGCPSWSPSPLVALGSPILVSVGTPRDCSRRIIIGYT